MAKGRTPKRDFDVLAWGLLFIWWGLRWWVLISLPNGAGLLGSGLILLSLNAVRWLDGIPARRLTTTLGVLALSFGGLLLIVEAMNVHFEIPIFEVMLVTFGIFLVIRELMRWRKIGNWGLR